MTESGNIIQMSMGEAAARNMLSFLAGAGIVAVFWYGFKNW